MIKKLIGESGRRLKDLERAIKNLEERSGSGGRASDTELSRWQQGHDVPTREQLRNLCAVLKVSPEKFGHLDGLRVRAERRLNADRAPLPKPDVPAMPSSGATSPEQSGSSSEAAQRGPADAAQSAAEGQADPELTAQQAADGRPVAQDGQLVASTRSRWSLPRPPAHGQDPAHARPLRVRTAVLAGAVVAAGIAAGVLVGKARSPAKASPSNPLCRYQVVASNDNPVKVLRAPDPTADVIKSKDNGENVTGPCDTLTQNGHSWTKVYLGGGGTGWMDNAFLTSP